MHMASLSYWFQEYERESTKADGQMRNREADNCIFMETVKFKTKGQPSDKECNILQPRS